jgi:transcriptional repressor NrdR
MGGKQMKCPYCGFEDSKVTDSRAMEGGIRRRRECLSCGQRFTTAERVELGGLVVVKKDGRKACEKRPIPHGSVEALVDDVETQVHAQGKAEVPTSFVGELVIDRLRDLDEVAYIRFASVYRAFRDVDDLKEELAVLERNRSQPAVATAQLPLLPAEALEGLSARRRRGQRGRAIDPDGERKRRRVAS